MPLACLPDCWPAWRRSQNKPLWQGVGWPTRACVSLLSQALFTALLHSHRLVPAMGPPLLLLALLSILTAFASAPPLSLTEGQLCERQECKCGTENITGKDALDCQQPLPDGSRMVGRSNLLASLLFADFQAYLEGAIAAASSSSRGH